MLQRQIPHVLLGLSGEGQSLAVVLTIPGLNPRQDVVCDDITGIVSQFRAGAFQVYEVVQNIIVEALEALWQVFVELVTNMAVAVIDREMPE